MSDKRRNITTSGIGRGLAFRGYVALLLILVLMLLLCARFAFLQLVDPYDYKTAALDQYTSSVTITAKRGTVFASDGSTELAVSATVYNCFISPNDIQRLADESLETSEPVSFDSLKNLVSDGLSEILSVDKSEIDNKCMNTASKYQVIKKFLTESEEEAVRLFVEENALDRVIHLEETTKRYYRYGTLAAHLIGFTGTDNQGLSGIESVYNEYLSGVDGKSVKAADGYGNELDSGVGSTYISATDGYNVVTTIDWSIQNTVEKYVRQCYEEHQPNGRVECIVMDVSNGEILASAIYPNFDPNSYNELSEYYQEKYDEFVGTEDEKAAYKTELLYEMWNNTVATQTYEPGSTFKIITSAMALEEGAINTNTAFECTGSMNIGGRTIHCHDTSGHGRQDFAEAIVNSCNPAFIQIGRAVGTETFQKYFEEFGYDEVTGGDLLGEVSSIYFATTGTQFQEVELAAYSFGQTFKVTAIQHLRAMSVIANGGYLVYPHTVKSLVDDFGNVVKTFEYEPARQVISEETCDIITTALINSTKNASVTGYNVISKTGTSEKRDTAKEDDYISSCVTFAPAEDPQIAILVLVDDPTQGQYYGSAVAAPVVSNILAEVLPHLGISPDKDETSITVPDYTGKSIEEAETEIEDVLGVKCVIRGEGDTVVNQLPAKNTVISSDGVIILYTEGAEIEVDSIVPDVIGQSPKNAIRTLINCNLNISIKGIFNDDYANCKVVSQSLPEGEMVLPGTVIEIEFLYDEDIE